MLLEEHRELYEVACKGNEEAVDFLMRLSRLCRIWDDLYDGNREHAPEEINSIPAEAMFGFMDNKFYAAYRDQIWPQIMLAWNAWNDANIYAKCETEELQCCAHFIKNYCDEIVMLCAFLIGGVKHMRDISTTVRGHMMKGTENVHR